MEIGVLTILPMHYNFNMYAILDGNITSEWNCIRSGKKFKEGVTCFIGIGSFFMHGSQRQMGRYLARGFLSVY